MYLAAVLSMAAGVWRSEDAMNRYCSKSLFKDITYSDGRLSRNLISRPVVVVTFSTPTFQDLMAWLLREPTQ